MLDEELRDALELQGARGVERGAAVGVRGIEIDALLGRQRDASSISVRARGDRAAPTRRRRPCPSRP